MAPAILRRQELQLGEINSLAAHSNGSRVYLGRRLSDDGARENLAVLELDPETGALRGKRLFRDSPDLLPPVYAQPNPPTRPRSSITAIAVGERYHKLYLAAQHEVSNARPARFLTVYDLDEHGDPISASIRSYRADIDGFTGHVVIEGLVLNPVAEVLYMTGFGWPAVRYYRLSPDGEPLGAQPVEVKVGGVGKRSMAVNETGTRLYLGTHPRVLEVLRVVDGVPQLEPAQPGQQPKPLRTLASAIPDLSPGEGYLRLVHTPGRLLAARGLDTVAAGQPPFSAPLYSLALDGNGDVPAATSDWSRVEGFDYVALAHDQRNKRLWLARETIAAPPAPKLVPDGVELIAYGIGPDGLPGAEVERAPKQYAQVATLASAAGGAPVVHTRPTSPVIDYAAGEQISFRISRAAPGGGQPPILFQCRLARFGLPVFDDFKVLEGEVSAPLLLDKYATGTRGRVGVRLSFPPAATGTEWRVEAHYLPVGASEALVTAETVRSAGAMFLLPGYAEPPEKRTELFEPFSTHWGRYLDAAKAVALSPDERPEQFVVSAYSISGVQGHPEMFEKGMATLRALGINSVQLGSWDGITAEEKAEHTADFSPETGVYAPPLGYTLSYLYDGSLIDTTTGNVVGDEFINAWAEKRAADLKAHTGRSPGEATRFQLADEPGWYFPMVLDYFRLENPTLPSIQKVDWADPERKNAGWIALFQRYVAASDPELAAGFGDSFSSVVPIGASKAVDRASRRLFYWSTRFFVEQAAQGAQRFHDALQTAFKQQHAPDPRPEHNKLHVHINFGDSGESQWHKPYPNAQGDKNPDQGPDAATGGFDWFRLGRDAVLPSKHTYLPDANAQHWSYYADMLRSATTPHDVPKAAEFGTLMPGVSIGNLEAGAAYKLLSIVSRGAKFITLYAFGPTFVFLPPNSWSDNFAAYAPLADTMRLLGRSQRVLYPGVPERGSVAIHVPSASRLWDRGGPPMYYREPMPLHTALVHEGYAVDFVDDASLAAGALAAGEYTTLYLLGPNLDAKALRAVTAWVRNGGTLVALPGAGVADEADEPTTALEQVLGLAGRATWSPLRERAHTGTGSALANLLEFSDNNVRNHVGAGELLLRNMVTFIPQPPNAQLAPFPLYETAGAQVIATLQPGGASAPKIPAITRHGFGRGAAYTYAFYPAWQYWSSATHPTSSAFQDRLPRNWNEQDRRLATLPARLANTPRSVQLRDGAVEARRLESGAGIAVVLFNWTGAPLRETVAVISNAAQFTKISSARHGALNGSVVDGTSLRVALPLTDVDVLMLEK